MDDSECIVSGTLSFVLYLSHIVGLAPLSFERVPNGWKIKPSKTVHVYGIILVSIFSIFASVSVYTALVMEPTSFHVRKTIDRVIVVFTLMLLLPVGIVGAVTGMKRMRYLTTYLVQVDKVNKELMLSHKVEKSKEWKIFVAVICLLLFGNLNIFTDYGIFIHRVIHEHGHVAWLSLEIFGYILVAMMQMIAIQFCLITYNVLVSFQMLNVSLRKLLKRVQDNTLFSQTNDTSNMKSIHGLQQVDEGFHNHLPRNATSNLRRLTELYCSLCDVVRVVSESHGTLLVQLLMALLLYLILTPYRLIIILFYSPVDEMYTALPQAAWVVFHGSILLIIVEPCHRTHEEIIVAKKLISHLMRHTPPSQNAFNVELLNFYRHLTLSDVIYSPLGMFSLSRGLIMTILGSITTYLVVIVSL